METFSRDEVAFLPGRFDTPEENEAVLTRIRALNQSQSSPIIGAPVNVENVNTNGYPEMNTGTDNAVYDNKNDEIMDSVNVDEYEYDFDIDDGLGTNAQISLPMSETNLHHYQQQQITGISTPLVTTATLSTPTTTTIKGIRAKMLMIENNYNDIDLGLDAARKKIPLKKRSPKLYKSPEFVDVDDTSSSSSFSSSSSSADTAKQQKVKKPRTTAKKTTEFVNLDSTVVATRSTNEAPTAKKQPRVKMQRIILRRIPSDTTAAATTKKKKGKRTTSTIRTRDKGNDWHGNTRKRQDSAETAAAAAAAASSSSITDDDVTVLQNKQSRKQLASASIAPRREKSGSVSGNLKQQYQSRTFIQSDVYQLLYAAAKSSLVRYKDGNPIVKTLKHAFTMAHSMTPRVAFKGIPPSSRTQMVKNMREMYFRKVDILMRVMRALHSGDVETMDLRNILVPQYDKEERIRSCAILTQTAANRTIKCALDTIASWDENYFGRLASSTRVSANARWVIRLLCDIFIANLIRQAHAFQLSSGCSVRLLPQHFIAVELERRNTNFDPNGPLQLTADPVAKPSYLKHCFSRKQLAKQKKQLDIPYEVHHLRHIIRVNCFMTVQNGAVSLRYLNAKVFEAVVQTIAYTLVWKSSKTSSSRSKCAELQKTHGHVIKGSDIATAAFDLYGIRLLNLNAKSNKLTSGEMRTSMSVAEIEAVTLTRLLQRHEMINKVMMKNMIDRKTQEKLLTVKNAQIANKAFDKANMSVDTILSIT